MKDNPGNSGGEMEDSGNAEQRSQPATVVISKDIQSDATPPWMKGIPLKGDFYMPGWYFQRRLSNGALQIVEVNYHGFAWRVGASNSKFVRDLKATGDYEWLGPITPEALSHTLPDIAADPVRLNTKLLNEKLEDAGFDEQEMRVIRILISQSFDSPITQDTASASAPSTTAPENCPASPAESSASSPDSDVQPDLKR